MKTNLADKEIIERLNKQAWSSDDVFATRLMLAMKKRGIEQRHLIRSGAVTKGVIYNYMLRGTMPTGYILQRLCSSMNVSADYLLGLKDEDTPCS